MRIVFFGTPDYVVPILQKLHNEFYHKTESGIVAVVTQKPKPTGRKQTSEYSKVDHWAHKRGIKKYYEPEKLIKDDVEADIGVLASYGKIIEKKVINHFKYGIVNIHPSLLPEFRGASPVQATISKGDKVTGISFMMLDEKLDHGPIISQFKDEVAGNDTTETLRDRLFIRSSEVLPNLLKAHVAGKTKPKEQNHDMATFTRQIKKDDAYIPPDHLAACLQGRTSQAKWGIPFIKDFTTYYSPITIDQFIRAMRPWPTAWTYIKPTKNEQVKRLKLLKSSVKGSKLYLAEVQLEGKNPVSWEQFAIAYPKLEFES